MNIKLIFLFLIIFFSFGASSEATAQVQFSGVTSSDMANLKKKFPELKIEAPELATLDEIIRYLALTETYSAIRLIEKDKGYTLQAVPLKRIAEINITGNEHFSNDEILAALKMKIGSRFDSAKVIEAGEDLKELYAREGYFNTIVSFNFEDIEDSELRVLIKIREREPCLVKEIEINTPDNNIELRNKLLRLVKKDLNKNFTEGRIAKIESTFNEYLLDKRYLNTKVVQKEARYNSNKSQVKLYYDLIDPYSYEILLSGNNKKTRGKLLDQVKFSELAKGGSDPAEEISQKIRDYYINNGFAHAKVTFTEKVIKKTFTKRILIDIEEGPLVKIQSLDVVGRISRNSSYYANFIFENSSDMIADKIYVRSDLENGYKNLTIFLNNQGYLKAKVQSARIEYNDKKDRVQITVILDEGPLTQLSKISFYGAEAFDKNQLLKATELKSNTPLRLNALEKSIELLKEFYHSRGYIEMKLLNQDETLVQYDDKGLKAELHFKISEGPQVYVKSIYIDGNTFTKDYVILREAGIDPGDLVTPELIEESRRRLDNLQIFSRVDIRTLEANTDISQRTIVIRVQELNPGLFRFGVGVTNEGKLTARGFSSLSYNNIAGTARAVSLRGTVQQNLVKENYIEYEAGISYLEPFILNKRVRGRAGYTRSEKITNKDVDEKVLATDSIKLSLEKDLTSRIKFSWLLWGLDSVEKFDLPESGPLVRESRQEIAYVGPSLDIDYRDNSLNPTKGMYTKIDGEYSSPEIGSSTKINFVRTQGQLTHYLRVGSPHVVWANSFRAGYEKNLSSEENSGIPESFAFFLGGYNTVRGYTGSSADRIPNNIEFDSTANDQLIIEGESRYYLVKSEVRFPLWSETFGGVVFYDAGQVDIQGYDFKHPIRQSYGLGIRLNTPVGPISLDYARKVNTVFENESPDQWHLSIGTF